METITPFTQSFSINWKKKKNLPTLGGRKIVFIVELAPYGILKHWGALEGTLSLSFFKK